MPFTEPAREALQRLQDGNKRFYQNQSLPRPNSLSAIKSVANQQTPWAVILGCSDSRVPVEQIFDTGVGDLFVIRVAGNIVRRSQLGSIEFAVQAFGIPLLVVLGHSRCGAVGATWAEMKQPSPGHSPNLKCIIDQIRPGIEPLLQQLDDQNEETLKQEAVQANVRASLHHLVTESSILTEAVRGRDLSLVGAEYSLDTGAVKFLRD